MLIYGWNSKNLKQAPLEAYECPGCKTKNSVIAIFGYYVHIFWIPLFPYKKPAHIVCLECEFSQVDSELPPELRSKVKALKGSVPIPKYMFSGLAILLVAAGFLYYSISKDSRQEQEYIANPQIGDVYILKDFEETTSYNHYLLKVTAIVDDSLQVTFNAFSYNGIVDRLDAKDGFYDVWYSMHKNELTDFDKSGKLRKVIREYQSYAGFDRELEYNFQEGESESQMEEETANEDQL